MSYRNIFILVLLLAPAVTLAQVETLVGIPGLADPSVNIDDYINTLYALSISIAAFLAVIKIIIAGVKWMMSDIVTSKEEAKKDIWGSTLGLLLIISAVLIFNTINPQITTTSLFIAPVNNPTYTSPTLNHNPDPPMSGGDVKIALPNTAESQQECESAAYGGVWYSQGSQYDTGWCVVNAELNQTIPCEKLDGNVTQINSDGVEVTAPAYDCTAGNPSAIEKCTNLGGTVETSTNVWGDAVLNYQIECNIRDEQ